MMIQRSAPSTRLSLKPEGLSLRTKLLAALVLVSVIPLITVGFITQKGLIKIGDDAIVNTSNGLIDQAKENLMLLLDEKANYSSKFFQGIAEDTYGLQLYTHELLTNPSAFGNNTTYPNVTYEGTGKPLAQNLPSYGYINLSAGEGNGAWADWDHKLVGSPYLNSTVVKRAKNDSAYAKQISELLNKSMLLDMAMKPIYEKNVPNVTLIWVVFLGGVSNAYSSPPLDFGKLLYLGTMNLPGGLKDNFDEDNAEYIKAANPINNPKREVVWLEPYFDTVGNGWIISAVAPIYVNNNFIGVVGIDVKLTVLHTVVSGMTVLKTGHAFVITPDGNVVSHKDVDQKRSQKMQYNPWNTDVYLTELESNTSSIRNALTEVAKGNYGIYEVKYDDEKIYMMAFTEVPNAPFVFGATVLKSEVIAPVAPTTKLLNEETSALEKMILYVDIIIIVVTVIFGVILANLVIRPVIKMAEVAFTIGRGELDKNAVEKGQEKMSKELTARKDEVGELANSFNNMLTSIHDEIKKQEQKPQQVVIEIKDSVVMDTDLGKVVGDVTISKPSAIKICPFCGKELNFPKPPKFCPFCKEKLIE